MVNRVSRQHRRQAYDLCAIELFFRDECETPFIPQSSKKKTYQYPEEYGHPPLLQTKIYSNQQQYELQVKTSHVDCHALPAEPSRPTNAVDIVFTISIVTNY